MEWVKVKTIEALYY